MFGVYAVIAVLVFVVNFIKGLRTGASIVRIIFYSLLVAATWPAGVIISISLMAYVMISDRA
jgi:hypothetical protein